MKKVIKTFFKISIIATTIIAYVMKKEAKKTTYQVKSIETVEFRKINFYEKYVKRIFDIACAVGAIVCFSPLYIIIALTVRLKLGSPVLFTQNRPGLIGKDGKETIFKMYKFRTMTDDRDENGALLPDEARLTKFGAWLRATSLDELPEAFNILNGTMSVIGPRPQLVRDMTFMTKEQRKRHTAKPGLSGLAQISGRNAITWDDKLDWDLEYIKKVNFFSDLKLILNTILKAFIEKEGITDDNMVTAEDLGDYLLRTNKVSQEEYIQKQRYARDILNGTDTKDKNIDLFNHRPFSVAMSVYKNDNPIYFDHALYSITETQTIMPDEIVLIVDGPISNKLNDVINKYNTKYSFFKIIRFEHNRGLGNALRIAIENAKYEYIARMDSDDLSVPTRFEEQLNFFANHPEIDIVGGDIAEFVSNEAKPLGIRKVPVTNREIKKKMKTRCPMNHMSVMYKKSSVLAAGGYQNWFWNEDYYLWIRMLQNGAIFANTGTILVNVRVGDEMYQRRGGIKYFYSEKELQDYMLENKMINSVTYIENIVKRLIVQLILPNKLRGWVYRIFARQKVKDA